MNYTQGIGELVDRKIAKINAISIGVITKVNLGAWRADVRLKSKIDGRMIEIANVPIGLQIFAAGAVHIAPAVGDIVIVGFSKHEVQKQLKNRDVVDVNELVLHNINHAIIMSGVHVESDSIPAVAAGEILINHKSGAYFKISSTGAIELKGTTITFKKLTS